MKAILALMVMTVAALGDLDAWNSGTNSNVRVGGIVSNSITNVARTAGTFVVAGADKSDVSTATSAVLAATLSDETGSGLVVFGTNPTITTPIFNTSITITNNAGSMMAILVPDAANTLALRNGVNAQVARIYNTFSDASNYERGVLGWSGVRFVVGTESAGTGSARILKLNSASDMEVVAAGYVKIDPGGSEKWYFKDSGPFIAASDNAYDIGASGATRPRTAYVGTSVLCPLFSGGPAAASPGVSTFQGINGTGTDKNGGPVTIQGGYSTGIGRGGNVVIQTSTTGTTASTANSYQDRARYVPKFIDITDNTATTIFTVTLPATNTVGIQFVCTVQASDGTDFQSLTTPVTVDAVAKTTTITAVVAPTAAQTALAGSGGTLSVTYTVVDAGSNVLAVKVTADTSFSSTTYLRAKLVMTAINGMGAGWSITEI